MKKSGITLTEKIMAELFGVKDLEKCCILAEILGFMMAEGNLEISSDKQLKIVMNCHSPSVMKRLYLHFHALDIPVSHSHLEDRHIGFSRNFQIFLPGRDGVDKLFSCLTAEGLIHPSPVGSIFNESLDILALKNFSVPRPCCTGSFMRALFMSRGSVSRSHGYNLELTLADENLLEKTIALLAAIGITMSPRIRGQRQIAHARATEVVQDFFALTGAHRTVLEIANNRIIKEVKNNINRSVNCDSANLNKTAATSTRQIAVIRCLEKNGNLELLPEQFRITAALRLRNPYESYENLGKLHSPPLKKSVIQYRLGRICEICELTLRKRSHDSEGNQDPKMTSPS